MNQYCDTYITISQESFIHNAKFFKQFSQKKLISVIKSNAYGHGLLEAAHILEKETDLFAVASLDSAIALREDKIQLPILILNPLNAINVKKAVDYDLMITVSSLEDLKKLTEMYEYLEKKIQVHIKIDSGMNRMGLKTKTEYQEILHFINESKLFEAVGVYTHFHTPDNKYYSQMQIDKFRDIYKSLPHNFLYVHLCSTNATLNNLDIPESTHVRIGLGLYGLCDSKLVKPVLSMYSKIVIIKKVLSNEIVGYNANFKAGQTTYIGVLPCGYSDGIIRGNVGRKVYVDGHYCNLIGSVCMNSMMIELPNETTNQTVELIGPHISALEIANYLKTISYEVTTILPAHLKRIII